MIQLILRAALAISALAGPLLAADLRAALEGAPPATPYVRAEFAAQLRALRPAILASARRHNDPALSQMSDEQFAATIAQVLYNEHVGWLEDALPPLRAITPLYQQAQIGANQIGGLNASVWPSNLRPSVAAEIVRSQLPVPGGVAQLPLRVAGSHVDQRAIGDERALYRALNDEISRPELAIEFLAANLERGVYRARYQGAPVTWQTLAAWHNQGIVLPAEIAASPAARHYLRRAAAYRALAEQLIAGDAGGAAPTAGLR